MKTVYLPYEEPLLSSKVVRSKWLDIKQLLDEAFVISRINKVGVCVISRRRNDNPYRYPDYSSYHIWGKITEC